MTTDLPADLWKRLTSTVGLVTTRADEPGEARLNVMAAEWAYFVNKQPLYAAVSLGPRTRSRRRIEGSGEFSLTLCADDQAALADFAGGLSVADADKTTSDLVRFGTPEATRTPWVTGGVLALECRLLRTVPMPSHTLYIGEAVAAHLPDAPRSPLVKHGAMRTLGGPAPRTRVVAAAGPGPDGTLRIAATSPADPARPGAPWRLSLRRPDGTTTDLGTRAATPRGDLLTDVPLPPDLAPADLEGCQVLVERGAFTPGTATVGRPPTTVPAVTPVPAPGAAR